jgi:outer membrane protein assembly factor BamB
VAAGCAGSGSENWPRWRGPGGTGVSGESSLPLAWSATEGLAWKTALPGEGSSSPVIWGEDLFLTASLDEGSRRLLLCFDRSTGRLRWQREVRDANPERASALTGHAAATPATDGRRVVVFHGNAGAAAYDLEGNLLWRWTPGEFDSELGLASSPVLHGGRVFLVCDHDGDRFRSFDSFLIALDAATGRPLWKTDRPGLGRSWSTPIVVPSGGTEELIVSGQDELRAYDPETGVLLWKARGTTGWVTPSPVFGKGLIIAVSGKDGPTLAVRAGGRGDVTESRVAWREEHGGPYVCSPLLYGDYVYIHDEDGRLTCREAASGRVAYRTRLAGRFIASAAAGDGRIYLTNTAGTTFVVAAGPTFTLLAENPLDEEVLASPALSHGALFLRTRSHLVSIPGPPGP